MLAKDYAHMLKTNLNNKKTYIFNAPYILVENSQIQRRTLQAIRSGWIFTHTSGRWTWELTCCQMAARDVNNWTLGSQGPFLTVDNTRTLQTHSVYECISLSLSYSVMIHDDLYTLRHYAETVYKVLVVLYKVRRAKHFNSLSGVPTDCSFCQSGAGALYANPVIIYEFDFEKCSLFLKTSQHDFFLFIIK